MTAKSTAERIDVQILDRSYQLSCTAEEKPLLMECVALVDARMRQVKANSKLSGLDRIAVMAALTLARDFLSSSSGSNLGEREEAIKRITAIADVLDQALVPQEKLF